MFNEKLEWQASTLKVFLIKTVPQGQVFNTGLFQPQSI